MVRCILRATSRLLHVELSEHFEVDWTRIQVNRKCRYLWIRDAYFTKKLHADQRWIPKWNSFSVFCVLNYTQEWCGIASLFRAPRRLQVLRWPWNAQAPLACNWALELCLSLTDMAPTRLYEVCWVDPIPRTRNGSCAIGSIQIQCDWPRKRWFRGVRNTSWLRFAG